MDSFMSTTPVVPPGYEAILDEASNCYYYWNKQTGETTWEAPNIETDDEQYSYYGSTHGGGRSQKLDYTSNLQSVLEDSPDGFGDGDSDGDPRFRRQISDLTNNDTFRHDLSARNGTYSTSFMMEDTLVKVNSSEDDEKDWKTKGKVLNNWQGQLSDDDEDEMHPIEAGRATVQYAPNVLARATFDLRSTENMLDTVSEAETSIGKMDPLSERFEATYNPAGVNVVSELLETEDERKIRKFRNMRKNGAILITTMDGWEQWRSPHGAVFYSREGDQGGQWNAPFEFPEIYGDKVLEKKVGETLQDLKLEYTGSGAKKNAPPSSPIKSISPQTKMRLPDTLSKEYTAAASGRAPGDLNRINLLDRAFVTRAAHKPGDEKDDIKPTDPLNFDEENDIVTGHEKPKAVDAATKRLKDIYKSLRFRDKALDNNIELNEVKRKADEAKHVWEKYLDSKAEEDYNKEHYGGNHRSQDSDDEDGPITDFNALYARSIIVQQRWPWTALVDVQTDRTFYRNEVEDYFQYDPPPEMLKYEIEIMEKSASMKKSSTDRDISERSITSSTQNRGYDRDAGGMTERYKMELEKRREHERTLRSKMKELFKSDSETDGDMAASTTQMPQRKNESDNDLKEQAQPTKKPDKASDIIERITKQIEAKERSKKPAVKALYAAPTHAGGRRTSMFNVNITKFVRKYKPTGIQAIDENEDDLEMLETLKKTSGPGAGPSLDGLRASLKQKKEKSEEPEKDEPGIFVPPPIEKHKFTDLAWIDAQTLLKRLRWFSANHDKQRNRAGGSKGMSASASLIKSQEGASVRSKWSKIKKQLSADISELGHSGVDLGEELREDMEHFALLRAKRVGKNASLQELKAAAAIRRKICHESKVYIDKVKSSLETINSYLYEDDETITTLIESEIYRRHTLEAAVFLKGSLVRPITVRDMKAYTAVPNYVLCPQAAVSFDLSLPKMISHSLPSRLWEMLQDPSGRSFFSEKGTGLMQGGEPFDIEFKRLTKSLKYERWYDFGRKHILQEKKGKALPPEIMSDPEGGLLFYCPYKKLYNWREQINISYYDLAPDVSEKKSPAAEAVSSLPGNKAAVNNDKPSATVSRGPEAAPLSAAARVAAVTPAASTPATGGGKRAPRHSLMSRAHLESRSPGNLWANMNTVKNPANPVVIPALPEALRGPPESLKHTLDKITEGMPDITEDDEEEEDEDEDEGITSDGRVLLPSEMIRMSSFKANEPNGSGAGDDRKIMSKSLDSGNIKGFVSSAILQGRKSVVKKRLSLAVTAPAAPVSSNQDEDNDSEYSDTIRNVAISNKTANDLYGTTGLMSSASKNPFDSLLRSASGNPVGIAGSSHGSACTSAITLDQLDMEPLEFEEEMQSTDYAEYCSLIAKVKSNPNDIRLILDLAEFFLAIFLHKEGLACLTRVLDLSMLKPLPVTEFATVTLMVARLSAHYLGEFRLLSILKDAVQSCPDYPPVLCLAAKLYEILRADEAAEQLYIGATLINPDYCPALEGYASLLIRQGNLSTAVRYLNRIDEAYTGYPVAKLKLGWVHEILGAEPDVVLLVYQSVLGLNLRNRPTVLTYAALGHHYHVRGDLQRALDYYKRGLKYDGNDVNCLMLHAAAVAASVTPGTYQKDISKLSISTADSHFRRGLFFNQKGSNRWIGLLAYADFLMCCKKDAYTAEDVLWEGCRISCQHAVWPTIALIHHYQYMRGNIVKARRVILWVMNRRKKVTSQTLIRRANIIAAQQDAGPLLFGEAPPKPVLPDDIQRDLEETVALLITEAYCSYDAGDFTGCGRKLVEILDADPHHVSALRLQGLLDWQRHARVDAMIKLDAAHQYGPRNVYFLRTYAVASALVGEYDRAIKMMITAVEMSALNPLCWRALGVMSYLYENDREHCLDYFSRAFELSGEMDLQAMRLKGQVLMELGRYEEARVALRAAMKVSPGDPILLATLAMCLVALGYQPTSTAYHSTNYDLKFQLMDDLSELTSSKDPQELMEAAICTNLEQMVTERKKRKLASYSRNKVNALGKGWNMIKNLKDSKNAIAEETKVDQDAHPQVLYWYGLYCLHRGSETHDPDLNFKAKELFKRAIQRRDYPPHPLALHMLGWMAELEGDIRAAERYYCHALQLEPIEPEMYLQLASAIKRTHDFVKSQAIAGKGKKLARSMSSSWKKKKRDRGGSFDAFSDDFAKMAAEMHVESAEHGKLAPPIGGDLLMQSHKRMILHDRVLWLLNLRSKQMDKYIKGIYTPGKFVYLDAFWLDHLMHSFAECDDWATLLKTCPGFRNPKKHK